MDESKTIKLRPYAAIVCDIVNDLLDEYHIVIPDKGRGECDEETALLGVAYDKLEEQVTDVLKNVVKEINEMLKITVDNTNY